MKSHEDALSSDSGGCSDEPRVCVARRAFSSTPRSDLPSDPRYQLYIQMLKSIHFSSFFLVHQGVFYTFFSCRNCASCPENHPQQAAAVGICGNLFNTKRLGFLQTFFCACFSLLHSTLLEGASARGCCSVLRKEKRKQKRNQLRTIFFVRRERHARDDMPSQH